ncbi:MAG: rhodanese-like domain-containing protein, partial [Bacteroidia bacterium]
MGPSADFKALTTQGATIIDVRSKAEYASGHIKGS